MPERMELAEPNPADTFGARLRYQRERRKISIATIAEATKILGALIEGLERDDVSRWPTGLYRRAFLRAYASAIGLDPEATLREFLVRFPEPEAMVLVSSPTVPRAAAAPVSTMSYRSRCIAAGVDWFVLSVIGLTLYLVLGSFWAPVCVAAAMYFSLGVILLGNTPGVRLVAEARSQSPEAPHPVEGMGTTAFEDPSQPGAAHGWAAELMALRERLLSVLGSQLSAVSGGALGRHAHSENASREG